MKIPVFVSTPSKLNNDQKIKHDLIIKQLAALDLEQYTLGTTYTTTKYPFRDIYAVARHCSGGLILGFEQCFAEYVTHKRGTEHEKEEKNIILPTPWNQIEAGILFSLGIPLLVLKEEGISGGIFDPGASDVFIHTIPEMKDMDLSVEKGIEKFKKHIDGMLRSWYVEVYSHFLDFYGKHR